MLPKSERCDLCGFSYIPAIAKDRREHDRFCWRIAQDYSRTWKRLSQMRSGSWFRPKLESEGVYRAMNDLNPLMIGFQCNNLPLAANGFTAHDWQDLQSGKGLIRPTECGSGHGHDRFGEWQALDGRVYTYHANWRCGQVYFWLVNK